MAKTEKIKHYFTLEKKLNDEFQKYLDDNYINKQRLIEALIKNYLKEKNKLNKND